MLQFTQFFPSAQSHRVLRKFSSRSSNVVTDEGGLDTKARITKRREYDKLPAFRFFGLKKSVIRPNPNIRCGKTACSINECFFATEPFSNVLTSMFNHQQVFVLIAYVTES